MTDDIVTRLRICVLEYGTGDLCAEAADEIELLRANLKQALDNNDFWRDATHRATCPVCQGGV